MTIFTPLLCFHGIFYLYVSRLLVGFFSGLAFPSINMVYSQWTPPLERSRASGYALSGMYCGAVFALALSGFLADTIGWQSIFYVTGVIGVFWTAIWFAIVRECPADDCWMYEAEKKFIKDCLELESRTRSGDPPWRAILTSAPVYAITSAHASYAWGFYTLITLLPAYMRDILHFDIKVAGYISAIPYLVKSLLLFISGYIADWFQVRKFLSVSQVRKYFTNVSFFVVMLFLLLVCFVNDSTTLEILFLTFSVGLSSFAVSGFFANPLDIAPQFASIIVGFSNTWATVTGLASPIITGHIATTPVRL